MELIDIVDSSVDDGLLYYQAKACEKRVTDEALYALLLQITSEAVVEISEVYIATKPRPIQFNPLLEIITLLTDDIVTDMAHDIGKTSIRDIVTEHLADRELYNALDVIIADVMDASVLIAATESLFDERCVELQSAVLASFLRDRDTGMRAVAQESLQDEIDGVSDFLRQKDRAALKVTLQKTFGRRAVLSHLMMSMTTRFDRVLMTHFTKGVLRRTVIQRLVHLMENVEGRVQPVMHSQVEAFVFEKIALPSIQDELINQLLASALDMEDDMDFVELQHNHSTRSVSTSVRPGGPGAVSTAITPGGADSGSTYA